MIRLLRRKLTAITMVLLTVMLLIILVFVYHATASGLKEDSMAILSAAPKELGGGPKDGPKDGPRDGPEIKKRTPTNPCFILEQRPDGTLTAIGSDRYDLSDREDLLDLLWEAENTGKESGVLKERQLRFLRQDNSPGTTYIFMDISVELETLERLNLICAILLIVGLAGFFLISVLLSRWAVRPVEVAWIQQRQFVADASHELKTPLTVILTNAELLGDPDYDSQSKSRFASNILTMSRQMRGLVEELLDQARVDNGAAQAKWERLSFSQLVEDAVLPFEPVYFEAGRVLDSQIHSDLWVQGSADHLRRVVEVLLDNGCKYSAPESTVVLQLARQGRNCLLSVSSPGVSLTEQQCQDIFKRFYRVDSVRIMNRSYGLGLPIAQGIVEGHKGKIWAESRNGLNTFFVTLPLS